MIDEKDILINFTIIKWHNKNVKDNCPEKPENNNLFVYNFALTHSSYKN